MEGNVARWQENSDPIAFADWFHDRMRAELIQLEEAVVAKRMEIEQAPPSARKTMLQRAVQALKRHRDMHFQGATEDAPASIIITTLAARAYSPGGSLHEVLGDISARMPDLASASMAGGSSRTRSRHKRTSPIAGLDAPNVRRSSLTGLSEPTPTSRALAPSSGCVVW